METAKLTETIATKVSPETVEALDRLCSDLGLTRSALLSQLLQKELTGQATMPLELARIKTTLREVGQALVSLAG